MNPLKICASHDLSLKLEKIYFNIDTVFYWTKYGTALILRDQLVDKTMDNYLLKNLGLIPAPTFQEIKQELHPDIFYAVSNEEIATTEDLISVVLAFHQSGMKVWKD